jgi:hypothetical protein
MPAIAETDEAYRKADAALWPQRFSVEELELIRREAGGAVWASLCRKRPAAAEGAIFKRDQWQFYDQAPEMKRVIPSLDTAFKTATENDFSVIAAWGEGQTGYYLLSLWRDRVEFPKLKQTLVSIALWGSIQGKDRAASPYRSERYGKL